MDTACTMKPKMDVAKKKILVIDRDPDIREVTRIILEQMGQHEVVTAIKAELIRNLDISPDLILLDCGLCGSKIAAVCKNLKRLGQEKPPPLVIFSTNLNTQKISHSIGADDYITKPFQVDDLLRKVEQLISGHDH